MTTRNLVPRSANEGQLGTDLKPWQEVNVNKVYASNNVLVFNSVAEMKSSNKVKAGYTIKTLGFYEANDGGGADYVITNDIGEDEADEASIIALQKGLYANLVIKDFINVKQWGAKSDTDLTEAINKAQNYLKNQTHIWGEVGTIAQIFIPKGYYQIKTPLEIDVTVCTLKSDGACIYCDTLPADDDIALKTTGDTSTQWASVSKVCLEGFTLMGKFSESRCVGLAIGAGNYTVKNVTVVRFKTNLKHLDHAWCITYINCCFSIGDIGIDFPLATDAGERNVFIGCFISANRIGINPSQGGYYNFYGCSINLSTESAINLPNDSYGANVNFYGGWFENNNRILQANNAQYSNITLDGVHVTDTAKTKTNPLIENNRQDVYVTIKNSVFNTANNMEIFCNGKGSIETENVRPFGASNELPIVKSSLCGNIEEIGEEVGITKAPEWFLNSGNFNVSYTENKIKVEPKQSGKGYYFNLLGKWDKYTYITLRLKVTVVGNGNITFKPFYGYLHNGYPTKTLEATWINKSVSEGDNIIDVRLKKVNNYPRYQFEVNVASTISSVTLKEVHWYAY